MDWLALAGGVAALLALGLLSIALARARRDARRFVVLDRIARVSDGAADLEQTLEAIADVLVPDLADCCAIDVVAEGRVRRAVARVAPGGAEDAQELLAAREPSMPPTMISAAGGDALEPRFIERLTDEDMRAFAHGEEDLAFLRSLGVRSAITTALRARGRVIGTLTMSTAWSGRRYRAHDARFARVLSGRVALALDNAGLFSDLERAQAERTEIAATLQRGLMPPPLPRIPGWATAAMYRPAGAENQVGGDFYDAFPFAGGWMLVIGDVTGRGARAATVTAQARYTLRTAAGLSGDPLIALSTLNNALLGSEDTALCGVVVFALSTDAAQPVRLAVAGHLPPLLVDSETVTAAASSGPVLGAFEDASWDLEQAAVRPGQALVAVTDGITEAYGGGERFGEARLHAELGGVCAPASAVERLEAALLGFTDGPLEDDAAALAIAPA